MIVTYDVGQLPGNGIGGTVLFWQFLSPCHAAVFTMGLSDCIWIIPGSIGWDGELTG